MKDALRAKDARLEELETKVTQLEETVQHQQRTIVALQLQIDERPSHFAIHPNSADSNDKTAVAATGIPKSCADLRYMGHTANGLYLIMGTEKVETVYCDFTAFPSDQSKIVIASIFCKVVPIYSKFHLVNEINVNVVFCRFPNLDRTGRRQIVARTFLCSEKCQFLYAICSYSV